MCIRDSRRAAAASSSDDTQDDQTPTAGQPPDATPTTGGKSRVDQSREKKGRVTPPTPSAEGDGAGKKSPIEVRFDEFWNAYPKKVGKQYALKAWRKIKPTAELHEAIMQAVNAQKHSEQWRRDNGRFIPNPATWLNGGYWENGEEVSTGEGYQRDPQRDADAGRDWGKGFKLSLIHI